ncbi:MAG: helix-turn-helix domain-containing protein [Oscillospiraceae bacterium]|jgi:transcriptional regulator with XRE-family HTH domain|nr:helix-turn-helix domain-containing protein [Oscillospiraceae bacterium]
MNDFPHTLKALRKEQNMTQQTVADNLNISQQAYCRYETGEREPSIDTLNKLARLFRVPVDVLIGGLFEVIAPEYKLVTAKYNISNARLMAKVFEQAVECIRAGADAKNVLTGEPWEESAERADRLMKEKKTKKAN